MVQFSPTVAIGEQTSPVGCRFSPGFLDQGNPMPPQGNGSGSQGPPFVRFFPKNSPMDDLLGIDFSAPMACPTPQPKPVQSGNPAIPAIVDLLDLEPHEVRPQAQPGDIWAGRAKNTPFEPPKPNSHNEVETLGRYSTPRAGTTSRAAVYTPGGTRVPDHPSLSPGYASPKHAAQIMFTPGGTRVPDSPPLPTPPKAVSFGDVSISQLPTSPIGHVGPLSPFGNCSQPQHHYLQLQPPCPRPELGLPQQGSWDSLGVATPISGSPVGPPIGCLRSEEPSRLVTALPNLEVGEIPAEVSIACGDWIARIGPLMRSLSPSAPTWWSEVHAKAFGLYEQWLLSDPITRLSLKAQAIAYQANQDYLSRVEESGFVLILQSLPKELQTEAISVRALSCVALLFMIFARYQPGGGGAEKATILAFLTQPQVDGAPNLQNCHLTLRKWDKMYRRCKELGLQTPDPLLLVRALDILARPLNGKPQHAFRLSTFRHSQNIDVGPHEASVLQYCEMLIAESEQALLSQPDKMQKLASLKSDDPES